MGTSSSSKGPHGGVSFDPPWLTNATSTIGIEPSLENIQIAPEFPHIADANRFTAARRNFRKYISGQTGRESLRKALRAYVRHGLGGAARASNRMRFVSSVGSRAFALLKGLEGANILEFRAALKALLSSDHSVEEIVSTIVEFVVPDRGSVDEESAHDAMAEALSELLDTKPDIDLFNMEEADVWWLMELYLAKEIVRRIHFDIGQSIESDKYDAESKLQQLEELEGFVKSAVTVKMQQARERKSPLTQQVVCDIMDETIKMTFSFFEGDKL